MFVEAVNGSLFATFAYKRGILRRENGRIASKNPTLDCIEIGHLEFGRFTLSRRHEPRDNFSAFCNLHFFTVSNPQKYAWKAIAKIGDGGGFHGARSISHFAQNVRPKNGNTRDLRIRVFCEAAKFPTLLSRDRSPAVFFHDCI